MNKREFLNSLALLVLGGALAILGSAMLTDQYADRRFALYNIRRELRQGTARGEVEAVISRHDAPYIKKDVSGDSIRLTVMLGGRNWLYLDIRFSGAGLMSARFGGEDNPWDVPNDAPSNIE